jgi:aryl-alcohol dehydrogenase-like predicted oxidoreductase
MQRYLASETLERIDALAPLAAELDVSLAELALAWCLRDRGVSSVLVGATDAKQLEQNCRAADLQLPEAILQRIDELFAPGGGCLPEGPDTP